jgi:hypothetical protein
MPLKRRSQHWKSRALIIDSGFTNYSFVKKRKAAFLTVMPQKKWILLVSGPKHPSESSS